MGVVGFDGRIVPSHTCKIISAAYVDILAYMPWHSTIISCHLDNLHFSCGSEAPVGGTCTPQTFTWATPGKSLSMEQSQAALTFDPSPENAGCKGPVIPSAHSAWLHGPSLSIPDITCYTAILLTAAVS